MTIANENKHQAHVSYFSVIPS